MKLTRVVPAVAAMAMLAACSPTAGTALVVDGQSVSEADLTRMVDNCTQIVGQEIPRGDVVRILIMGSVFDGLATASGQTVEDDQFTEIAGQMLTNGDAMIRDADCGPVALAAIKNNMLAEVDQNAALDVLNGLDVQMNPRYGRFTPGEAAIFATTGSLSVPADAQQ